MPRIQRNHNAAVIEVSFPLNITRGSDDDEEDACVICAHAFCVTDACCTSVTHLRCCTQALCCGCAVKVAKRCKCSDECEAVITICPFCREIGPVNALDVFLGTRVPCKACAAASVVNDTPAEDEPGTPAIPPSEETPETPHP